MSRVSKVPIAIPAGVTVTIIPGNVVTVKGPKGELVEAIRRDISIAVENAQVVVIRPSDVKEHRALHGLTRTLLSNMVVGASWGFSKTLELNRAGYGTQLQGKKLVMGLGYLHPVEVGAVGRVGFKLGGTTKVIVEGINEEKVGAAAASIRSWKKSEPYKGKGIKYSDEVIGRKEGKAGK